MRWYAPAWKSMRKPHAQAISLCMRQNATKEDSNLPMLANVKGSDFQIVCGASGLYMVAISGPGLALPNLSAGYPP